MTDERDRPISELFPEIERLAKRGAFVFLKWTCPKCGERVMANDPNGYHMGGYRHEEKENGEPCGEVYTGKMFGCAAILPISGDTEPSEFFDPEPDRNN